MVAMHGAILAFRLCGIREIGLFYPSLIAANKVGDFFPCQLCRYEQQTSPKLMLAMSSKSGEHR
jgi:hypothetical protein